MSGSFSRKDRVAEQIRRELAELLRLEVKDPRVGMVSLTEVAVTPDFAHARVYYSVFGSADDLAATQAGLDRARGFLRREIGRRVRIHTTPELTFVFDRSLQEGSRLSKLIDEVRRDDDARQVDDTDGDR